MGSSQRRAEFERW